MIGLQQIEKYSEIIKDVKASGAVLLDTHMHPLEIILDEFRYERNKAVKGVFSFGEEEYAPPTLSKIKQGIPGRSSIQYDPVLFHKLAILTLRRRYMHIGPKVLEDNMDLCGIDKGLLLPVAPVAGGADDLMSRVQRYYGENDRFIMGYSIPNTVPDADIEQDIAKAREKHNAKAIKIHPSITGIDLQSPAGKERVERILSAGGSLGMPVVIHGGRSPEMQDIRCREYAYIDHLMRLDFSMTQSPVIIAHGATFGCGDDECEEKVIPLLKRLLERNDNLFVDTAGVSLRALELMFSHIDSKRIAFGSDALYLPQWESLMKVSYVMEKLNMDVGDGIFKIASVTPAALL